jgi:hypothetical protein
MAQRQGKCINFGLCTMADSREAITLPEGEDFSCPECGKMLTELEGKGGGGGGKGAGKSKLVLAGLAVALLAVGGYFLLVPDDDSTKKKTDGVEDQKKGDDDARKKADEDARKKAEEDTQRKAQEDADKKAQEDLRRQQEQAKLEKEEQERVRREKLKVRKEGKKTEVSDVVGNDTKYTGPSAGTIVWEGNVHGTEFVTIDNGSANRGALVSGKLPGVPVLIQPQNPKKVGIAGAPGPENKYQRVTLRVQGNGEMKVVLNWSLP